MVTEERSIESFGRLKVTGIGHLYFTQSDTTSLTVKAPAALLKKIKTEVSGDTLTIGIRFSIVRMVRSIPELKNIEFRLSAPKLEHVIITGACNITGENPISGKILDLKSSGAGSLSFEIAMDEVISRINGAGNINLKGTTNRQEVRISGAGKFEGFELESKDAMVDSSGSGQCFINASESLDVTIRGVGRVKYKGQPKITSHITGLGNLESGN
jgi:hypothetical protein